MIDPKFDHSRPLRYVLAAVDTVLIAWLLYVITTL